MKNQLTQLASSQNSYRLINLVIPYIGIIWLITFCLGLYLGLFVAPADYQQGEAFRIIYVHVPSAILSLLIYLFMAAMAIISIIWRVKLADMVLISSAPIGALFTFLALFTGSVWGKPMWGTWWIWDARLTSELILLFIYFAIMALYAALPDKQQASRTVNIVVLIGVVNIPIIHYSVNWWQTLHQGATISQFAKPSIAASMLYPLLVMLFAYSLFFIFVLFLRLRNEILLREQNKVWVKSLRNF